MIKKCLHLLLDLFYPRRAVCMACGSKLGNDREDVCEECRAKLIRNWVGPRTPAKRLGLDGAAYAHPYAGPGGGMVRSLKYRAVWVLAEDMGAEVARAVEQLRLGYVDYVTAVPMHPKRQRRRGENHAELLAKSAARHLNLEYRPLLARTRNAVQQARLDRETRRKNLDGGFAVPEAFEREVCGAEILLIDDVLTTGATAVACATALKRAGARKVWFAAYAIGERK